MNKIKRGEKSDRFSAESIACTQRSESERYYHSDQ